MKELEARKRALAAESEIYRQTLKLEVQNLRLYAHAMTQRCSSFGTENPLLLFGAPALGSILNRRRSGKLRFLGKILSSWQVLSKVAGLARGIVFRKKARRTFFGSRAEDRAAASNI